MVIISFVSVDVKKTWFKHEKIKEIYHNNLFRSNIMLKIEHYSYPSQM